MAAYLPEWRVGDAAELARASAAAYSSAYGALSASQSARDLVEAELTEDVRVCAQVDAVDIVAIAEPIAGRRARITALP
jgi:phosphosulfolactate phosphohydrolase-like enzyme